MTDVQRTDTEAAAPKGAEPSRGTMLSVPIESKLGLGRSERRSRRPLPDVEPAPGKRARTRRHAKHG